MITTIFSRIKKINVKSMGLKKFEETIEQLLRQNTLHAYAFELSVGIFSLKEQRILNNKYIAAIYHEQDTHIWQIQDLATRYKFNLDQSFDSYYNVVKRNIELQDYTKDNVPRLRSLLFAAAVDGNLEKIMHCIKQGANINRTLHGRHILHVLCEGNKTEIIRKLPGHVDINVADLQGDYPITIACRNGNLRLVKHFLQTHGVKTCGFNDADQPDYNINLDLFRLSIQLDNCDLLELLVKHAVSTENLVTISINNLTTMFNCAQESGKSKTLNLLNTYRNTLLAGGKLFAGDKKLQEIADAEQGICRFDLSFVVSVKKLCRRYDVEIVKYKDHRTLKSSHDLKALFDSIKNMIAAAKDTNYMLYNNHTASYKKLTDEEYRQLAEKSFCNIRDNYDAKFKKYSGWVSDWYDDGSEARIARAGISAKDAWCLALLAARDKHAFPDKIFSAADIKDREQILVRTMVECQRGYNVDDNFKDTGGEEEARCMHGMGTDPFLSLSKQHPEINMQSNPDAWAAEVAKEALTQFFLAQPNKILLSKYLCKGDSQLSEEQELLLDNFYVQAEPLVKEAVLKEVGLLSQGGYLFEKELKALISNIKQMTLPIIENQSSSLALIDDQYADFSLMPAEPILSQDKLPLGQYKLPATSDSIYAAILLSASDMGLSLEALTTVQALRSEVADILHTAFYDCTTFAGSKLFSYANNAKLAPTTAKIIQQRYANLYPAADRDSVKNYIYALRNYAIPDSLCLLIISALYSCNIKTFGFNGCFVSEINAQPLFLSPINPNRCIYVSHRTELVDDKTTLNKNFVHALVSADKGPMLLGSINQLHIKNIRQNLKNDQQYCIDYEVMLGRNVAGLEQIKIPGDGNCCFNSVLVAARQANIQAAFAIEDCHALRRIVQNELKMRWDSLAMAPEQHLYNDLANNMNVAIYDYNAEHERSAHIYRAEEYIDVIGKPGCWGGHLELQLMAQILQVKIVVNSVGRSQPTIIGEPGYSNSIHLYHAINHYNVLVKPNTWSGLRALNLEEKVGNPHKRRKLG